MSVFFCYTKIKLCYNLRMMRLNKYIAACGVCSRRKADEKIFNGSVSINGQVILTPATQVDEKNDSVMVDGEVMSLEQKLVYYLLNKPTEVMCTCDDPQGRKTVLDFIKTDKRVYPVGRLDYDSSGLLILTNDGDLMQTVTHPSKEMDKEYEAVVRKPIADSELSKLRQGVFIEGKKTHPASVDIIKESPKTLVLRFIIHEGRNRQIRKMVRAVDSHVYQLKRTRLGEITLANLPEGAYRELTDNEVRYLKGYQHE